MKNIVKLVLCTMLLIGVTGCGESKPKCEHINTAVNYELSGLSIRKTVVCNDCGEQLEKTTVPKLSYVYDKVLVDEKGIKCTLLDIEVDG